MTLVWKRSGPCRSTDTQCNVPLSQVTRYARNSYYFVFRILRQERERQAAATCRSSIIPRLYAE
eukprot:gene8098-5634_t